MIDKDFAITDVKMDGADFSFSFKAMGGSMEFEMKLKMNGDDDRRVDQQGGRRGAFRVRPQKVSG